MTRRVDYTHLSSLSWNLVSWEKVSLQIHEVCCDYSLNLYWVCGVLIGKLTVTRDHCIIRTNSFVFSLFQCVVGVHDEQDPYTDILKGLLCNTIVCAVCWQTFVKTGGKCTFWTVFQKLNWVNVIFIAAAATTTTNTNLLLPPPPPPSLPLLLLLLLK